MEFTGIINVTSPGGGDSTATDNLEFEVKCKANRSLRPDLMLEGGMKQHGKKKRYYKQVIL